MVTKIYTFEINFQFELIYLMIFDFLVAGYNDVSWHNKDIISPNLDKLAMDGIILESHYTQPICTPTR